ncbi:MAG TPA: D-2-hydroxyacid dehydrogenase [Clostridia bacterium]|nr:D-2-hydroxyacid dehydrogenase [Clostridia bacterium]HRX41373.1 D-2-hydroxyacid dehydrogenase [Clostridia bacterium]
MKILVTDGIDKAAAEKLRAAGHEVVEQFYETEALNEAVKGADAIIVRSATKIRKGTIDAAAETGQLKLIIRAGVGIDNIDADYAESKGISVRNTPMASSNAVAELALAHMLAVSRFIGVSNATMRNGEWNKNKYKGVEISGKKLGLIGFGRIARSLAEKAKALGMTVVYTDILGDLSYDGYEYMELPDLLGAADFISLHVPYDKEKGALLGREEFATMKDGVYVINCARGGVVDEKALLEALNSGKVAGAGIDVFEDEPSANMELINHENVSVTPHIGASTKEAQKKIGMEIVSIIENGGR